MNYIAKLQAENKAKDAQIKAASDGMAELKAYLLSSKFSEDPSVQVNDVLMRLREIENSIADAENSSE